MVPGQVDPVESAGTVVVCIMYLTVGDVDIHYCRADERKLPEHVISGSNHSMDGRQYPRQHMIIT